MRWIPVLLGMSAVVVLLGSGPVQSAALAPSQDAGDVTKQQGGRPELRRALRRFVRAGAPGIVALAKDRRGTWRGASGLADLPAKVPMRPNVHFRIASVTKTFTATIVLQLVGERKLGLDDPDERWLPGVVPNGANINVLQLLQ